MLKLEFCLTRLPALSLDEFQTYWRKTHAPLVAAAKDALAIRRYVQVHTVDNPLASRLTDARPGMPADDYDGIAELWWDGWDSLVDAMQTEEGARHGAILAGDEAKFIDFTRSRIFFGEEHRIIGD
ncbi:MAG: EthD domain-containing protein [Pacificimonas sp.]